MLSRRLYDYETIYRKAENEKNEALRSLFRTKQIIDERVLEPFVYGLKEWNPSKYEKIVQSHYNSIAERKAEAQERYRIDSIRYNRCSLAFEEAKESLSKIKHEISQAKIRGQERINAARVAYITPNNPSSNALNNPSNNLSSNSNFNYSVTGKRKRSYSTYTRAIDVSKNSLHSNSYASSFNINKRAFSTTVSNPDPTLSQPKQGATEDLNSRLFSNKSLYSSSCSNVCKTK